MAVVPMSGGREIPIIADDYVDREFGTGALKITPGHDPNDYAIGKKVGLPVISIMNKDGTLNENAGTYCGLDRFEARKKLWADMETAGLVLKSEPYTLRVPRSQRGGEVVEPLVSKQWFVTMQPLADKALKARENGDLRIIPERFEKVYDYWLTNIKDWCISRQLWWGHSIPVRYVEGHEEDAYVVAHSEADAYSKAILKVWRDSEASTGQGCTGHVVFKWALAIQYSRVGGHKCRGLQAILSHNTTVLETGHDILFFWVARVVMMGIEFTGRTPFSTVYLHGLVRDAQGRKMSKTLGNVINPLDTIKEFGTDALRFTLATGTTLGQGVNLSMERLTANRSFTTKLWNAGKFILQNLPEFSDTIAWKSLALGKVGQHIQHSLPLTSTLCLAFARINVSGSIFVLRYRLIRLWLIPNVIIIHIVYSLLDLNSRQRGTGRQSFCSGLSIVVSYHMVDHPVVVKDHGRRGGH